MRKVILVANRCTSLTVEENCDYIGVDKGALYCLKHSIPMRYAIGDFDSLDVEEYNALMNTCEIIKLPCRKNETDGEYAIRYAHQLGYDEIDVYGVIGGRQDHFLVILRLMKFSDIQFRIIDEQNTIYCLNKGVYEIPKRSKYFSIFACEEVTISLSGVSYPLSNMIVKESDIYLVSNEIIDVATLETSGKICIIESKDA